MSAPVIVIEGLFGELGGWARRPLKEAGIAYSWFPWWRSPKLPDGCILIGHSLGGGKAIKLVNAGLNPKMLITIDPRLEPKYGFKIAFLRAYKVVCFNYYQTGFMRGYHVGAAENHHITGYSHTQMPMYPEIIKLIKGAM